MYKLISQLIFRHVDISYLVPGSVSWGKPPKISGQFKMLGVNGNVMINHQTSQVPYFRTKPDCFFCFPRFHTTGTAAKVKQSSSIRDFMQLA